MVTPTLKRALASTWAFLVAVARLAASVFRPQTIASHTGEQRFIFDARRWRVFPIIAGAVDDDEDDEEDDKKDDDEEDKPDKKDDDEEDDADKGPDWKRESRKHERNAKKAQKERDDLRKALKEREDADKSEQQKAIDDAREEARAAAKAEADKERRTDRLETEVLRLATRGVTSGEGDDAKRVKFNDPDDAEAHLQRAINRGDVDVDDLFDDSGRVNRTALSEALAELLTDKPHLQAGSKSDKDKTADGDADGGKGDKGADKDDETDPGKHLKRIQNR